MGTSQSLWSAASESGGPRDFLGVGPHLFWVSPSEPQLPHLSSGHDVMTSPEGWLHGVNKLEHRKTTVHYRLSTRSAPTCVQAQGGAAQVSGQHPRRWDVTQSGTSSSVAAWSEWNILEENARESTRNLRLRIPGVWLLTSQVWRRGQTLGGRAGASERVTQRERGLCLIC